MASPPSSSPGASARMRANVSRGTAPELRLRRELHRRGMRYRVHVRLLPETRRTADIAFMRAHLAVFVDGCFWHGCPIHGSTAKSNSDFWAAKILQNKLRDADTNKRLRDAGWTLFRVWEHQVVTDVTDVADQVQAILEGLTKERISNRSKPIVITHGNS